MINSKLVWLFASGLLVTHVLGEEDTQVGLKDLLLSRSPSVAPSTDLLFTFGNEVDFDSNAGGFSYRHLELDTPLSKPIQLAHHSSIFLSLNLRYTDFESDSLIGDQDLYRIMFDARWIYRQKGSPWSWTATLTPGFGTDGDELGSDSFLLNGTAGFRYKVSEEFAWLGGIAMLHDAVETRVFPGVGFMWKPSDHAQVMFTGIRLNASWRPSDEWLLELRVEPGGGAWSVESGGVGHNVGMRSFQAMVGVEHLIGDGWWLGAWAGVTFANELEIETFDEVTVFDDDADAGWMARIGVRKVFW